MDLFDSLAIVPVVLDAPGSDIPAELGFTDNFMTTPQTSFGFNQVFLSLINIIPILYMGQFYKYYCIV